jgi:hypothetical protein
MDGYHPEREPLPDWLPDWLPHPVKIEGAQIARLCDLADGIPGYDAEADFALVRRFFTDERMRAVWRELEPRSNVAGVRRHLPAGDETYNNPMRILASTAINLYRDGQVVVRSDNLNSWMQHLLDRAAVIREIEAELVDAEFQQWVIGKSLLAPELHEAILKLPDRLDGIKFLAEFYETLAGAGSRLFVAVERQRADPRLRYFIIAMLRTCRRLYGQPLYGAVSTITTVLFGAEVKRAQVRGIERGVVLRTDKSER